MKGRTRKNKVVLFEIPASDLEKAKAFYATVFDWKIELWVVGGTTYNQPQDHGFMYGHGFQDLDSHIWEVFYMEPSAIRS